MQPLPDEHSSISYHKGVGIGCDYHKWNLLREDVILPAAVLSAEHVEHNLRWMQMFIEQYGVKLSPHGKTTMAPRLFHKQLDHGAWAITLATVQQVQVAHAAGVQRILMANQLVGKANMTVIRQLIDDDPHFDFYCLVDSPISIEQLAAVFDGTNRRRLQVLLEIGVTGGRTGVRNEEEEDAIINALAKCRGSIALAGVELFEGVIDDESSIRTMLQRAVRCLQRLINTHCLARSPPILSGAGSAWYDVVAEEFAKVGPTVDIVLRPGCYLTHDVGAYLRAQTRILEHNSVARRIGHDGALRPALHLWAYVQSIPEPNQAIIGLGKRDASFDSGYPVPTLHHRPGWSKPIEMNKQCQVTRMMDQHAFMIFSSDINLSIGDMIAFDISHPCLTFDKWRKILVIDNDYNVTDILDTYF